MSAAPFLPAQALDKVRAAASAQGLRVWVDHDARKAGKPFVLLQQRGLTLAEFADHKAALQWLGVQA